MIDRIKCVVNDRGSLDVVQSSSSPGQPQPLGQKYLQEYGNYHHNHQHLYYPYHHHHQLQQQQKTQLQYHQCSQTLLQQQQASIPQQKPLATPQQSLQKPLATPQQSLQKPLATPQQSLQELLSLPQQPQVPLSLQPLQQLPHQPSQSISQSIQQQIQQQQPSFSPPKQPPTPPLGLMLNTTHQQLYNQHQQQQHQEPPSQTYTNCLNTKHPHDPLPPHSNIPRHTQANEIETQLPRSRVSYHHPIAEEIAALKKEKAYLQGQLQEKRERRRCAVCLDNEYGAIFMPCSHLVTCTSCATTLTACPLCRAPVQYLVTVIVD